MAPEKFSFQSLDTWRKARLGCLGGSDAPTIIGVDPYRSPLQLYCEKLEIMEGPEDNEFMEWGRFMEPHVAEVYQRKTGRILIEHGIHFFRSVEFDFPMAVSLDREIAPLDTRGPGDLQIKTTGKYSKHELAEELPLEWQVQVQHEMAVMAWAWASVAVLLLPARQLVYVDVERNDNFIEVLIAQERAFFQRIMRRDPPAPDASDSTKEALKKLYPKDSGISIILPPEAEDWDTQRLDANAKIAQGEMLKDDAENKFKAAIGNATFGVLPSGVKYSWKTSPRKGYIVEPTEVRTLRRLKPKE